MPHLVECFVGKQYLKARKIYHKALKVVYNSKRNYDKLLSDNNEISVHQTHLCPLICEVFKSLNNLNRDFIWWRFVFKNIMYNLESSFLLRLPAAESNSYGLNSVYSEHACFRAICPNLLNTVNLFLN